MSLVPTGALCSLACGDVRREPNWRLGGVTGLSDSCLVAMDVRQLNWGHWPPKTKPPHGYCWGWRSQVPTGRSILISPTANQHCGDGWKITALRRSARSLAWCTGAPRDSTTSPVRWRSLGPNSVEEKKAALPMSADYAATQL